MKIGEFIEQQLEPIVDEWVAFAQTRLSPAHAFTRSELAEIFGILPGTLRADPLGGRPPVAYRYTL